MKSGFAQAVSRHNVNSKKTSNSKTTRAILGKGACIGEVSLCCHKWVPCTFSVTVVWFSPLQSHLLFALLWEGAILTNITAINVKVVSVRATRTYAGSRGERSESHPRPLYLRESNHGTGDCVGVRGCPAVLEKKKNIFLYRDSNPQGVYMLQIWPRILWRSSCALWIAGKEEVTRAWYQCQLPSSRAASAPAEEGGTRSAARTRISWKSVKYEPSCWQRT